MTIKVAANRWGGVSIWEQRKMLILSLFMLCLMSAVAIPVVELGILPAHSDHILLALLLMACIMPALIAWLRGSFDAFEPVYPVAIDTALYFVLMVAVVLGSGQVLMLGFDYRDDMPMAIFLALLALLGFYVGYYGIARSADQGRSKVAARSLRQVRLHRYAWFLLGFFSLLFVSWIVIGRVPPRSLWIFGGASYGTWGVEASGAKLGHLYAAQEALPACILLVIATRSKRHWPLLAFVLMALVTLLFAGLGVRARVLLMVGSAIAFYYLERRRRPAAWQIVLIALAGFFLLIGAIGYYRGTESSEAGAAGYQLSHAWDQLVAGFDIATTTALYTHWVPVYGYDWGRDFWQVVLTPIPSALWPGKYLLFGASPIEDYRSTGAAAAFFVEFYRSFGPAGVIWGMALIGRLCQRVYANYRENQLDPLSQIAVALLWAYMFHMYGRHSVTLIVFGMVYVFAPVWIMRRLAARRQEAGAPAGLNVNATGIVQQAVYTYEQRPE